MNKLTVAILALALTGSVAFAQGQGNGGGRGNRGNRGGQGGQVQPGGAGGAGMQGGFGGGAGMQGGGRGGRGGQGGAGMQGGFGGGQGGFGGGQGGMMGGQQGGGRGNRGNRGGGQGGMGGDFGGGMMGPGGMGMGGARSGQLQRTIERLKADTPREEALKKIEAKDKEAYAKAKKANDDAYAQLAALAKKAEVELPETEEQQKAKALEFLAKEKDAIDKLLETDKTDSAAAMRSFNELAQKNNVSLMPAGGRGGMAGMGAGAMQPGARGGTRANGGTLRQIQEKFPQEYEDAQKLRQTDPAAYREKIQELQQQLNAAN